MGQLTEEQRQRAAEGEEIATIRKRLRDVRARDEQLPGQPYPGRPESSAAVGDRRRFIDALVDRSELAEDAARLLELLEEALVREARLAGELRAARAEIARLREEAEARERADEELAEALDAAGADR